MLEQNQVELFLADSMSKIEGDWSKEVIELVDLGEPDLALISALPLLKSNGFDVPAPVLRHLSKGLEMMPEWGEEVASEAPWVLEEIQRLDS